MFGTSLFAGPLCLDGSFESGTEGGVGLFGECLGGAGPVGGAGCAAAARGSLDVVFVEGEEGGGRIKKER